MTEYKAANGNPANIARMIREVADKLIKDIDDGMEWDLVLIQIMVGNHVERWNPKPGMVDQVNWAKEVLKHVRKQRDI